MKITQNKINITIKVIFKTLKVNDEIRIKNLKQQIIKIKTRIYMIKKIVIGLIAGIVSGLFASGGGMIVVPALVYLLSVEEAKARATSLFVILPMVITSGIFYYKNDYIDWKIGILCAIGGMVGGFLGSKYLNKIPTIYLKLSFTIFLIYVSIRMIIS